MKLNKRFIAVLAAAVLMIMCAVPVFAEAASAADAPADVLLIAPAPASDSDIVSAADLIEAVSGKDAPANVGTSFMVMG